MKRRGFLLAGSVAGLSAGLSVWLKLRSQPSAPAASDRLLPDPQGILQLREGFRYRIVERALSTMDDGYRVPGRPDAMGCFLMADGNWALLRNHELDGSLSELGPCAAGQKPSPYAYDAASPGGVSRLLLDPSGKRLRSNLVLTGTNRNCAGGMSPWGWLTCEESVESKHGYVFLCSPTAEVLQPPHRIPVYGRFLHEAVAIDLTDHAAYLTEDRGDGCLYRYLPEQKEQPFCAGKLQALGIVGRPRFELGDELPKDATLDVQWIDVPHAAGEREDALRYVAQQRGAAVVRRGEGIWRLEDGFAITCTSGGPLQSGQVFHLAPTPAGGTLRLLAQSHDPSQLDMPDNITLTPWGDLLVCEDNRRSNYLRIITRDGKVLPFAHNALSLSEFAGACFSPDGRVLFVNMQDDGLTLAIEGPFDLLSARS